MGSQTAVEDARAALVLARPEKAPLTLRWGAFYIGGRPLMAGPYGGTGRRVRLKIGFRKECWFDSG